MKKLFLILGITLAFALMCIYFGHRQNNTYESETYTHGSVMQFGDNTYECIGKISCGNPFVFPDFHKLEQQYLSYWRWKVSDDVEFLESEPIFTGYDDEHDWSKDFDLYLRYYLHDADKIPVMYATIIKCIVDDDMNVYIAGEDYICGDKVENKNALEALGLFPMFYDVTKRVEDQELETYGNYILRKGGIDELKNPDGAVKRLLRLSGGKITELLPMENDELCVVYTFNDGSSVNIVLHKLGQYYISVGLINDEYADTYRKVKSYVENATAGDLKEITKSFYDNNGVTQEVYELSDNFIKLAEIKEQDAAIYGLYGCRAMVIRIGDVVAPIWNGWDMYGMELSSGDYDNDGTLEYSYSRCEGHGTGYRKYGINVVEVNGENIETHHFDDVNAALNQVTYEFDKENQSISWFANGQSLGLSSISRTMGLNLGDFKMVGLTEIQDMVLSNGEIELKVTPGVIFGDNVSPLFDDEINLCADVKYSQDGTFALENFRIVNRY